MQMDRHVEVLIVDGGSTDRTAEQVQAFMTGTLWLPIRLLRTGLPDVGRQRNQGAAAARSDWLLFLDADVIVPPGYLARLRRLPVARTRFIAAFRHTATNPSGFDRALLQAIYLCMLFSRLLGSPVTNGDCILVTRDTHELIGGFAEGALLGEDTDYGLRAGRSGCSYKLFWQPRIVGSRRRMSDYGRVRLMLLWIRVYVRVRRHGPIYPGAGIDYEFGNHRTIDSEDTARRPPRPRSGQDPS